MLLTHLTTNRNNFQLFMTSKKCEGSYYSNSYIGRIVAATVGGQKWSNVKQSEELHSSGEKEKGKFDIK